MHHIIVRGIKRRQIFSDDQDRDNFVERLGDIVTETQTFCFACALKKLGFSATELSKKLGVSPPSVSASVKRCEKVAKTEQLELIKD